MKLETHDHLAPTIDDGYHQYADLLMGHFRLLAAGMDEADKTTAIEDAMSELWERLGADQRHCLSGLGSDLNWVRRRALPAPRQPRHTGTSQDEKALSKARREKDWHACLNLLRKLGLTIPPSRAAHLRGLSWSSLGFPTIASVFYDFAAEFDSTKPDAIE